MNASNNRRYTILPHMPRMLICVCGIPANVVQSHKNPKSKTCACANSWSRLLSQQLLEFFFFEISTQHLGRSQDPVKTNRSSQRKCVAIGVNEISNCKLQRGAVWTTDIRLLQVWHGSGNGNLQCIQGIRWTSPFVAGDGDNPEGVKSVMVLWGCHHLCCHILLSQVYKLDPVLVSLLAAVEYLLLPRRTR